MNCMTKHPFEMLISFCTGNQFRISNSQTMFDFRQLPTICGNSTLHTGFEVNPKLTHTHFEWQPQDGSCLYLVPYVYIVVFANKSIVSN